MNKKKLNNNGFSLVELIIVIAIMAVLVGVLAPTFLQYVEKSKKSNDISTFDSILNAIEVIAVDPETPSSAFPATVTFASGTASIPTDLQEILGTSVSLKSEWEDAVITGTLSGGKVIFTLTGTDAADIKGYSSTLASRFE